ncbi:unnamed protein product [Adineta steineri]|uniref:Uncharacterized protein n=1 Tax=Adineta steineri TaxID=433720 RepID=A0A815RMZ5_9BILA|nr:unnamed protein product [Adineta steineri]CAF4260182.1 unnamed protein product [Adineta steineri]
MFKVFNWYQDGIMVGTLGLGLHLVAFISILVTTAYSTSSLFTTLAQLHYLVYMLQSDSKSSLIDVMHISIQAIVYSSVFTMD